MKNSASNIFEIAIAQNIPDAICVTSLDLTIQWWNKGAENMFGYTPDEILGKNLAIILPQEIARQEIDNCVNSLKKSDKMNSYESVRLARNGRRIPVEVSAVAIKKDEELTGYAAIMRDISERKRMQEELEESEANLRTLFNSTSNAVFVHDLDGKIIDVNAKMLEMYGVDHDEALRLSISKDYSSPDNPREMLTDIWPRVIAGESRQFEWKARRPRDGSVFAVEAFLKKIKLRKKDVILAMIRDMSAQKKAEEALNLTQFAIDHSSASAFLIDPDGRFLYANNQGCSSLGYSIEELQALSVSDIDPLFPASIWNAHWANLKKEGSLHIESVHRKKDGTVFPVELSISYLKFGEREYNWAFGTDISARKQAEAALRKAYGELEQKIRERTGELARTNEELKMEVTERQRAIQLIRKSKELSDGLNAINTVIHSTLDYDVIMQSVVEEAAKHLAVDGAMIGLFEAERFRIRYTYKLPDAFLQKELTANELRGTRYAMLANDVVAFNDAFNDERLNFRFIHEMGIRSQLISNVMMKGRLAGAIAFYGFSNRIEFTEEHIDFTRKLTASVSLALENAELYRALEESRRLSESRFNELRTIYETAPVGLCFIDRGKRYVSINRRLAEWNELSIEQCLNRTIHEVIRDRAAAAGMERLCDQVLKTGKPVENVETILKAKTWLTVSSNFYPVLDQAGEVRGLNIVVQDITQRKRSEEAVRRSEGLLKALLNSIPDMAWLKDKKERFILVNEPFSRLVGKTPEQLVGKKDYDAWPPEHAKRYQTVDQEVMESQSSRRVEEPIASTDDTRWVETIKTPIYDGAGNVIGTAGISRDITDRKRMEEEIRQMALHDPLTGLPNRRMFLDILNLEIAQSRRHKSKLAVLFIDLDRFKEINDTLGHDLGDRLLKNVAGKFRSLIRESDTVARLGGDEFNILLADIVRPDDVSDVAAKIVHALTKPIMLKGHELHVTASVGISIYPDDSDDLQTLLRYADIAMYHAKEQGRNKFQFYNHSINVSSLERMKLEGYLRQTVKRRELSLLYQPQIDIRTRKIFNAEALVRWNHPLRGVLGPKEFIPLAEETGYITTIDEWVLETLCKQAAEWKEAGLRSFCVAANLSARAFQSPNLVEMIASILRESGLPPECLDIEITERVAMSDVEQSAKQLRELRDMGVHISIDDFGTGYSSLNYLKKLPIERLKIDKSFVLDIAKDADDRAIISAVTSMARKMGIRTLAEGVETEEQLAFVRDAECDEAQGFLFSEPVTADKFQELIEAGR